MGHRDDPLAANLTVTPCLKGSVLEDFSLMAAVVWATETSPTHNVVEGSKDRTSFDVYSEIRRKPKNAVIMAAHIITLSA